jgi:hypothetical protein
MTEHPSEFTLHQYRRGELAPAALLDVDEHVVSCTQCRETWDPAAIARSWDDALSVNESRQPWWMVAAAAAVLLLVAVPVLLMRRAPVPIAVSTPVAAPVTTVTRPMPPQRSPEARRAAAALERGELPSAALLTRLIPPREVQRTPEHAVAAIEPASPVGIVVESDRPSFRWKSGEAVTVQVFDPEDTLVAESPVMTATSWTPATALPRGVTYQWQLVTGSSLSFPAPPDPPARFHVLSAAGLANVLAARQSGSGMEVGLLCLSEGLVQEGLAALDEYAAAHRESAEAARLAARAHEAVANVQRRAARAGRPQ